MTQVRPRALNPAVVPLLNAHWAMEPTRLAEMQRRLLALPAGADLAALYAPESLYGDDDEGDARPKPRKPYDMAGGVALIRLSGPLQKEPDWMLRYFGGTSTRAFTALCNMAAGDPDVSQILVLVDSPGGDVDGTADAADALYAIRQAGKKPVVAYVDGWGCSAAYWIAAQCSQVYAGQTAVVGSIGTRWSLLDTSAAYELLGLKAVNVTSGTYKAAGATGTPITDEDVAYFQGLVNDMQARFSAGVVRGRKLSAEAVRTLAGDARIYVGKAAQDAGLIDGVLNVGDLVKQLQKQAGASGTGTAATTTAATTTAATTTAATTTAATTTAATTTAATIAATSDTGATMELIDQIKALVNGPKPEAGPAPAASPDVVALHAQVGRLTGEKADLAAQVQSLTAQVQAVTAQVGTLGAEKDALAAKVQEHQGQEGAAALAALTDSRAEALKAATTAFGAGSQQLAHVTHLIEAQTSPGVLASMTAAYRSATPQGLLGTGRRQTQAPGVTTPEATADDFYAGIRAEGEAANKTRK